MILSEDQIESLSAFKTYCKITKGDFVICQKRYNELKDNCEASGMGWDKVIAIFGSGFIIGIILSHDR